MTRLLWLLLVLDLALGFLFALANFIGSPEAGAKLSDVNMRILIELAALAVIYEIKKVGK